MPDQKDFPLAAENIDGALNRAAEIVFHDAHRAYQIVRTS
jgi:hypothetical protein